MKNSVCTRAIVSLLIMSQTILAANKNWGRYFFKAEEKPQVAERARRRKILLSWANDREEWQSVVLSGKEISSRKLLQNAIAKCTGIPIDEQKLERTFLGISVALHPDAIGLLVSRK